MRRAKNKNGGKDNGTYVLIKCMNITNETRKATAEELTAAMETLLRENLVGITEKERENTLKFSLVNGQSFRITVEKV